MATDEYKRDFSFVPILALEFPMKPLATPFNFLPFEYAGQASRMQILASIPFSCFHGMYKNEETVIIEFTWRDDGLHSISNRLALTGRPIVLWLQRSGIERVNNVLESIQNMKPLVLLVIADDPDFASYLSDLLRYNPLAKVCCATNQNSKEDRRAFEIWEMYLNLLVEFESIVGQKVPFFIAPDNFTERTFADLLAMARTGNLTEFTTSFEAAPLYDDFIYYPNAIVANHSRRKMTYWRTGKAPDENSRMVYDYSNEIIERKVLDIFLTSVMRARVHYQGGTVPTRRITQTIANFSRILPEQFIRPLLDVAKGVKSEDEAKGILSEASLSYPKDIFRKLAIPQFILVCQSYPFSYNEAIYIAKTMPGSVLSYLHGDDDDLYRYYFDQAIKGGRVQGFDVPVEDERNMSVVKSFQTLSIWENNYVSALSTFYAIRRRCPVFKTHRASRIIFSLFHQLDELISGNNAKINSDLREDSKEISELIGDVMEDLSKQVTSLVDSEILDAVFSAVREPMIFVLSDIPLDFIRTKKDYLGYDSILSRLPITPGKLPLDYYNDTASFSTLENDVIQTIIITSFCKGAPERQALEISISQYEYHEPVTIVDISSRFQLINYLNNNKKIKCLIFFGHGGIDRDLNESWIELPNDNFFNRDIAKLKHVPRTIVLIGCNTSSGGNTISGMDIPFLQRGSQVIATTFPIPLFIGTLFIGLFIANFLSAGVILENGARYYSDLSDILSVVKRRSRINSVVLNLLQQEKMTESRVNNFLNDYKDIYEKLEITDKGSDANPTLAIRTLLFQEGFISSFDTPLYEIEKIPYGLFFTCLGYTWHHNTKNFLYDDN